MTSAELEGLARRACIGRVLVEKTAVSVYLGSVWVEKQAWHSMLAQRSALPAVGGRLFIVRSEITKGPVDRNDENRDKGVGLIANTRGNQTR